MIRVGMVSLGCPKNQVDAELMLSKIEKAGFALTNDAGLADIVIINTCGFIESAKDESIAEILNFCQLKEEGRIKKVIVTGCLAQRYKDEVRKEIPEADAVIGISKNADIVEAINTVLLDKTVESYGDIKEHEMSGDRIISTLPFYAYLRIADGCSNHCSYCAIPLIRGEFRSRPMQDVIDEANKLVSEGVRELVLVAQDTTRYGEDLYGDLKLAELLNKLCEIDNLHWVRLLYCYPERVTDELLDVIARQEKIVKYMDIPIQHCNGEILRSMNRSGDEKSLRKLFAKIRSIVPGITLRTTFIVGFPGETEEQYTELAEFADDVKFERLGCFAYSREEDTPAYDYENQIEEKIAQRRSDIIMQQQAIRMDEINAAKIGREIEVVVEGFDRYAECYFGRSSMDAPDIDGKVFFTSKDKRKIGDFVKIIINETLDYDLVGETIY